MSGGGFWDLGFEPGLRPTATRTGYRLGDGECAAIAAATVGKTALAIDDVRARKKAAAHDPTMRFLDTVGLMVEAIQAGLLTVAEADAIKADWEKNHRFAEKHFASCARLFPRAAPWNTRQGPIILAHPASMSDAAILEGLLALNIEREAAQVAEQAEEDEASDEEGEAEE